MSAVRRRDRRYRYLAERANKALHFEMDHSDMACHFDLEFSPAFLNMGLNHLFGIFQRIAERRADGGLPVNDEARPLPPR
jgi:hypothetical protein